jgi:hypothetical protein
MKNSSKNPVTISKKTIIEIDNSSTKELSEIDIPLNVIIEALNDPKKGDALIKEKGWTKKDLVEHAGILIDSLADRVQRVSVV